MLTNAELAQFLTSIVALLLAAHSMGFVFERLRLPRVVGEITGGFLLGPSCLGILWPDGAGWLLPDAPLQTQLLNAFHWIGLTLLMFTAGFRVQHGLLTRDRKVVLVLLVSATVIPFGAGWLATRMIDLSAYVGPNGDLQTLSIVLAIAVAVTSIPVISRIFLDLDLIETRFARIVLAVSTMQDIILWTVLAMAMGAAGAGAEGLMSNAPFAVAGPVLFCAVGLAVGPIVLRYVQTLRIATLLRSAKLGFALIWCFLVAQVAALLNINIVFGAFVAGVALGSLKPGQMEEEKNQISKFSFAFFIPLYFALVGHAIDIPNAFDLPLFLGFLLFSTAVEGLCAFAAMRGLGFDRLTGFNFSVAMNTRGGPGIVLASVTYGVGLIDERLFVALVLTAITTSVVAGAWFRHIVQRGRPLIGPGGPE